MNTTQTYDATLIDAEDIATNDNNRIVLRRIMSNSEDRDVLYIQNHHDDYGEECEDYVPEGTNDMGWLGYFVGNNDQLSQLCFRNILTPASGASVLEVLEPFITRVNNNRSIRELSFYNTDLLGGKIFTMFGPFFKNNRSLIRLSISSCVLVEEGWRLLALAIGSSSTKHQSLTNVSLVNNNISDARLVDIITALSMHPKLREIIFEGNRFHKNGCTSLATLLRCSATELETLDLTSTEIDDEGLDALVPSLKSCSLQSLKLTSNQGITSRGWKQIATMLEAPNSNLEELYIMRNNIDDDALTSFANALMNNHTLTQLYFTDTSISIEGQVSRAFSKLLCDTSSINSTFLSNHTLQFVSSKLSRRLKPNFKLNKKDDKKEVAMIKILKHHHDFDLTPFFEWEFKVLPLMIDWFERASSITMPKNFDSNLGPRKLSSIYQFVRGITLVCGDSHHETSRGYQFKRNPA